MEMAICLFLVRDCCVLSCTLVVAILEGDSKGCPGLFFSAGLFQRKIRCAQCTLMYPSIAVGRIPQRKYDRQLSWTHTKSMDPATSAQDHCLGNKRARNARYQVPGSPRTSDHHPYSNRYNALPSHRPGNGMPYCRTRSKSAIPALCR